MSKTQINYDLVVKELSKGLVSIDSATARRCNMLPHIALQEFRTIRYGAGRQKGVTTHAVELASWFRGEVLYLIHSPILRDNVMKRYEEQLAVNCELTVLCGYLPENWQPKKFGLVIVDEAGFFFNKFSYDKIYRSLAPLVTDNVVIHLIN